jgi:hypothetical protein
MLELNNFLGKFVCLVRPIYQGLIFVAVVTITVTVIVII